ncbi:MAG TPA: orotate phosphoribosyltransferase [Candidatus Norongarragalinales archaeon]|nr:orotate phosphoribosyltransferase [Candidatus Norongarragalinales archaeon]
MNKKLVLKLYEIGAVKFGDFALKSGMQSPIYIDLRLLVSHPELLKIVAKEMKRILDKLKYDRIAGIPYAALPIATALSLATDRPMIYTRKEQKDYGTKKMIEGGYKAGETAVVVDDLVTTAKSKFEAIEPLLAEGLVVKDIVVLIDREQGGREQLREKGYELHACIHITKMLKFLLKQEQIGKEKYDEVIAFLEKNKV